MARTRDSGGSGGALKCSFCGKSQNDVRKLIAGPTVLHLRRVHRALQRHHRGGVGGGEEPGDPAASRSPRRSRPCSTSTWSGRSGPRRSSPSPSTTTTSASRPAPSAGEVELQKANILLVGPDRLGQDPPRPDPRQDAPGPVHHRRRHHAHRGRLRGRGRGEHHPPPAPGRRLRRRARPARHRLHRRDRQDRAQEREPLDHARRLGRGRAAGAAEDPRGHGGQRAAPGRPQAPAPGVHPGRHHQRAVHLRRRLRGPGQDRGEPRGPERHGLRRRREEPRRPARGRPAR